MARTCDKFRFDHLSRGILVRTPLALMIMASLGIMTNISYASEGETLIDRIVAEVNGEVITYSEVMKKVRRGNVIEVAAFPATSASTPFEVALQDLINKKIVIKKVEEAGIEMSDEKVEGEITSFLNERGSNREALTAALKQEGMSYEQYVDNFRSTLLIRHFQGRFIVPSIKISDKDLELHYFRMKGSSPTGAKLKLRQIFVAIHDGDTELIKEEKLKIIDKIMTQLNEGERFEELAKVYSDAPGASENGGAMPPVAVSDLAPQIQSVVEGLEEEQFSQPLKTPNGYYVFFLEDKILGDSSEFQSQRQAVEYDLRTKEMERETVRWIEVQRSLSKIRVIAD